MRKASSKFIDSRQHRRSEAVPLEQISSEEPHEDGQISTEITSSTSATQQTQEQDTSLPSEWSDLTLLSSEQKQKQKLKLLTEDSSRINDYQSKVLGNPDEPSNDSNNNNISPSSSTWGLPQQEQVRLHHCREEKNKNVLKHQKNFQEFNITEQEDIWEQKQILGKRKIDNQEQQQQREQREQEETSQQLEKRPEQQYKKFIVDQSEIFGDKKLEKLLKPLSIKDILNDMNHDWKFARDEMTDGFFFADNGYNIDDNNNVASNILDDEHDNGSPSEWIRALDKYIKNLINSIAVRKEKFQLAEKVFKTFTGHYTNVLKVSEYSDRIGSARSSNRGNDNHWQLLVEMIKRLNELEEVVKEINDMNMFQKEKLDHVLYCMDKDIGWFSSAVIASRPLTMAEKLRQDNDK